MPAAAVEDRLVSQKEAGRILNASPSTLRRWTWLPRVAVPCGGRKRKVTYKYRLSTLLALIAEWEEKPQEQPMERAS